MATPYGIIQLTIDGADIGSVGVSLIEFSADRSLASADVVAETTSKSVKKLAFTLGCHAPLQLHH